jgi:gliding motility-associated lipoprotein GldD
MAKQNSAVITSLISCIFFLAACNSPYTTKNKGYSKLSFPAKSYQAFDQASAPYSFEYPSYAVIDENVNKQRTGIQKGKWLNIRFPGQEATIYVSYIAMQSNQLDTLIRDAYTFANNHNNRASSIVDSVFQNKQGVEGIFFTIGGEVATPYQFFLTDFSQHFFRGALYYDATPNQDSLAPVNAFLLADIQHILNTFRWKK